MAVITLNRNAQMTYIKLHLKAEEPGSELYDMGKRDGFNEALHILCPDAAAFYVTDAVIAEVRGPDAAPFSDTWAAKAWSPIAPPEPADE